VPDDWQRQTLNLGKPVDNCPIEYNQVMRVLVVEDDPKIASFVVGGLKQAAFAAHHVSDGEQAIRLVRTERFDLLIVDLMLPGIDGLTLIERLRREKIKSPVLILSAKRSVDDRVRGLQTGGDDYLTKPFAFSELLARVQALIRRSTGATEATTLSVADLEMNLVKHEVMRAGRRIDLTPREFALLEYLLRNAGQVVSRTMIMEHVWDYSFDPMTNVVEARMCKLREKIDTGSEKKLIHTLRGLGYVVRDGA
jgi:two-component system, OmpR family, response regulator